MRVLFLTNGKNTFATNRYRCAHFAEALARSGIEAEIAFVEQPRIRVAHDVVVLHRIGLDRIGAPISRAVRACGATLVYSTDDLTFETEDAYAAGIARPDDLSYYRTRRAQVEPNAAMLRAADAVLVATEFLAVRARRLAPERPVTVVRNFLSDELMDLSARAARAAADAPRGGRVVLGYMSGTATHDADLADIAGPLGRLLSRHENLSLLLVGQVALPAELERFPARIRRHPFVDWRDLPGLLAGVDINLAPLDPTRPFNHAKSELKFLEAAAAGVPTIAAATAGFAEGVSHEVDGLLAAHLGDWETLLERLITHRDERAALARRARETLCARATPAANAAPLAQLFAELVAPGKDRPRGGPVLVRAPFSPLPLVFAVERRFWRGWARLERHVRLMAAEERAGQR